MNARKILSQTESVARVVIAISPQDAVTIARELRIAARRAALEDAGESPSLRPQALMRIVVEIERQMDQADA